MVQKSASTLNVRGYICPKCNIALDRSSVQGKGKRSVPQCEQGHTLTKEGTIGSSIAAGIAFTLFISFCAGLSLRIPGPGKALSIAALLAWVYTGIDGLVKGFRYLKMPEPAHRLAKTNFAIAISMVVTFLVLLLIALLSGLLPTASY